MADNTALVEAEITCCASLSATFNYTCMLSARLQILASGTKPINITANYVQLRDLIST